ncbi:hypothetical protein [Pedobacter foliorum]|uniref:hypothetical protein n=1 Tax=Pedobacter foliorum TaxID=2739058 RepID=UPI00156315FE|nr:hypothetical protein [Pedobacter foliorum]NRF37639.1 hypothetical protein [Pedobacter foliorum]
MMKSIQYFCPSLVLFLAFSLLFACKKDSAGKAQFPIDFYSESAQVETATRVYTKGGEIKDPIKIRQLTGNVSYFHAEDDQTGKGNLYLSFVSKDSIFFGNNNFKFGVRQSGEQFLFTFSLTLLQSAAGFDNIRYHLLKHENVVQSQGAQTSKEVRIAYGNHQELKLPFFAYRISSSFDGTPRSLFRYDGIVNNEFNESSLSMLAAHDTLAVKTYILTLKARK